MLVVQLWWLLCTLVLASVPYTIWEYKENGYSAHFAGAATPPRPINVGVRTAA